jgi:hypothetical protein
MPADLDELFAAFAAHADAVPTGTADKARRIGQRRRQQRVAATALAVLAVLSVATYTAVRMVGPYITPAHPRPTVTFAQLTRAYQFATPSSQGRGIAVVGSRLFVLSTGGPAGGDAGSPVRLDALDLTSMTPPFAERDLGSWAAPPTLITHQQALLVVGRQAGAAAAIVAAFSPVTGQPMWTQPIEGENSVVLGLPDTVVDYEPAAGVLRAWDWATGHELWQFPHPMNGTRLTPVLTAPTLGAAAPAGSLSTDFSDHRFVVVDGDGTVRVLDARNGGEADNFQVGAPAQSDTTYVPIGDRLYVVAPDEVRAFPLDGTGPSTPIYAASAGESVAGVVPCDDRICVTVSTGTVDHVVGVDPGTGQDVWRVRGSAATLVDGRILSADGELYDLASNALRGDGHSLYAWWLTAGSVLLVDVGYTSTNGGEQHAVLGLSTVDGSTVSLGDVSLKDGGCVAALQTYLACGAADSVDVWRFAAG